MIAGHHSIDALPHGAGEAFALSVGINPRLSEDTRDKYARTWRMWIEWLAGRQTRWDQATPEDVRQFLDAGPPGRAQRRRPKNPARMTAFTSQRYWRVLNEVYRVRMPDHNPAYRLAEAREAPTVPHEGRKSEVLVPGALAKLRDAEWVHACIPNRGPGDWTAARDRALIALAAHCGLATGDLLALTPDSLRAGRGRLIDIPQRDLPEIGPQGQIHVEVPANSGRSRRDDLVLPSSAVHPVWDWLQEWKRLGQSRGGPLFPSTQGRAAAGSIAPLTPAMVFVIVRDCVRMASGKPKLERSQGQPNGKHADARGYGPTVVRNSVLQDWLTRMPPDDVAHYAGLRSTSSLRLPKLREAQPK